MPLVKLNEDGRVTVARKAGEYLTWDAEMRMVWSDCKDLLKETVKKIEEERLG